MDFVHATINVENMEESLKFYQEIIGLDIDRRFNSSQGVEIVFLGKGDTKVELIYDETIKKIDIGQHIALGFQVKSLDEMMKFVVENGIEIHSGPFNPNPNTKFVYVLDPNGLRIQFIEF